MPFRGSYVAITTPWTDDGAAIDFDAYARQIEYQLENGTDGILPAGTTGESATLTHAEQGELIRRTVKLVDGRAKVLAGAGSNSTAESVALAKAACDAGADGVLVITPYYNKPTPDGLVRHFEAVGRATPLPMMLYNVPGRTGTNMLPETVARVRRAVPTARCVKEASGSVDQTSGILAAGDGIAVMSGDDSLTLPLMSVGALGVVSVVANIHPAGVKALVDAAARGDYAAARAKHYELLPLFKACFVETNPIPAKTALCWMKRGNGVLRLPLCPLRPESEATLRAALERCGLL